MVVDKSRLFTIFNMFPVLNRCNVNDNIVINVLTCVLYTPTYNCYGAVALQRTRRYTRYLLESNCPYEMGVAETKQKIPVRKKFHGYYDHTSIITIHMCIYQWFIYLFCGVATIVSAPRQNIFFALA